MNLFIVIAQVNAALAGFIFSIIILGLGTGGIKANVSALVADQCNSENLRVKRLRNGERVIVDPSLTLQRVFMYFYMCINFGELRFSSYSQESSQPSLVGAFASLITVYAEKDVGYWLAFLVPTLVFTLVPAVLLIGKNYYVKVPPRGSVVMEACKMVNMACRGRWSLNPFRLYRNFNAPDLWNVVKPSFYESLSSDDGVKKPAWITWDESFVLEVTTALRACKILTFYPIYWFANLQCYSNLISQAAVMKTNGTPNDLINNLGALFLIVLIPLFDRIIYPMLRRWRFTLTPIKRITTGFFIASIAMAHASIIQLLIYRNSPCGKFASTCTIDGKVVKANVNVWHQAPTYLLMSLSELLTAVSGLEYCYSKGPKSMKSIILSISMLAGSLCSILNLAMVPFAKDPYLVWNYAGTGVVTFIAANIFWFTFKQLDKDDEAATAHETNTHGSQDEL
ncbi:hypothetical protein FRC02_005709 [Tulasnella sp. 418]|nr:hypothetical protein FRC02_005709 [Tulasnella sp. 418]